MHAELSLCRPARPRAFAVVRDAAGDPTRRLRARMRAESDRRWQVFKQMLRSALIEHDLLGMRGVGLIPHGDKTAGFAAWLREELRTKVLGGDGSWMAPYVQEAAALAGARAAELAPGGQVDPARVAQMETLAGSELRGIVEAAQQQITRAVTQALMASATPTAAANATAGVLRTMCNRTRTMDDYIIVKTHGTATLSAFRSAGVTHVGIIPERVPAPQLDAALFDDDDDVVDASVGWSPGLKGRKASRLFAKQRKSARGVGPGARTRAKTPSRSTIGRMRAVQKRLRAALSEVDVITAGDDRVCPVCEEIAEEGPYDLDSAEDLIPAHARCRCIFAPAGRYGRDAFDPDEPRDPHGEWTSGGGEGGRHPGPGYSASAYVKGGVIYTNSVYDAQRALSENRKVDLDQLKSVSTLIKLLGDRAAAIEESGKVPPVFNLCNVSVEGTNIFCSENKGIPRAEMPVIAAKQTKAFIEHLKSKGYKVEKDDERAENLRATQSEISGAKVAAAMTRIKEDGFYKRLVISKDDYILDGHHTWAGQLGLDAKHGTLHADKSVKVARVNISITKLIEEAEKWTGGAGKKAASQSASDEGAWIDAIDMLDLEQPRYAPGEISVHGGEFAPLMGSQGHEATISSRNITAVGRPGSDEVEKFNAARRKYNRVDVAALQENEKLAEHNVGLFKDRRFYLGMQPKELKGKTTDQVIDVVRNRMADNLVFLANQVKAGTFGSKDDFNNWKHWYEGAHKIADDEGRKAGIDIASSSGVVAALSPQNEWNANVHQALVVMDTLKNKRDMKWDDAMDKTADRIWFSKLSKPLLPDIRGKSLRELEGDTDEAHTLMGMWIRTENEAHSDRHYREVKPDGTFGDIVLTTGKSPHPTPARWKATSSIANAVAAFRSGGDHRKLSDAMGERHKVRSFYNNILDPDSRNGDVTIDTHAVGAAWLYPTTGKDVSVVHNLASTLETAEQPPGYRGHKGSSKTGVQGTYALYADAYRQAAKELGVQPRELQSITWEAKRHLFSDEQTGPKVKAAVDAVWKRYNKGKMTLPQARAAVMQVAKETVG